MTRTRFEAAAVGLLLMTLGPFVANALPITWTLENVTFAGGATASGSFVYDADTNQYISRDIVFSALPATPFLFQYPQLGFDPGELDSVNSDAADLTGVGYLALIFGSILTDAGGTVALSNGFEGTCSNATCLAVALGPTVKGGSVTTATPEPATLALFPLGLFAFLRATVYRKSQGEA